MEEPSSTSKVATKIAMIIIEVGEVTCHKAVIRRYTHILVALLKADTD